MSSTGDEGSSDNEGPAVNSGDHRSAQLGLLRAEAGPISSSPQIYSHREAHGVLDKYEDDDDEDEERETRFTGPPSTWRTYTANERALAASLSQTRAKDLSIHLYNTHALKARLQRGYSASLQVANSITEQQDNSLTGGDSNLWRPDAAWTAWPVKPEVVPRPGEAFGSSLSLDHDDNTYRMAVSWRPREDLENEIQALMLRQMKFNSRRRQNLRPSGTLAGVLKSEKAPVLEVDSSSRHSRDRTVISACTQNCESLGSTRIWCAAVDRENDGMLDDDDASNLLQPIASHILEKLDVLLDSLHRSWEMGKKRTSRRRTRPNGSQHMSESRATSTRSTSRRPKHENETKSNTADTDSSDSGSSTREIKSRQRPRRRKPLRPRDWREVTKMASLVGWDDEILHRTTVRCVALFGDKADTGSMDMLAGHSATSTGIGTDTGASAPRNTGASARKPALTYCPIQDCARHTIPYEKPWRWREHMKRTHKYSKEEIQELENQLQTDDQTEFESSSSQLSAATGSESMSSESSSA